MSETKDMLGPVVECDQPLSMEQAKRIRDTVDEAIATGKALILPKGIRLAESATDAMRRIELKLNAMNELLSLLVHSLAEEEEEPTFDLEGKAIPGERDQNEPL